MVAIAQKHTILCVNHFLTVRSLSQNPRGFPVIPIKSLCVVGFPMAQTLHGTRRRMRQRKRADWQQISHSEQKQKMAGFIQAVTFTTKFHNPARGRADIPPGGARSRYDPETGRNGGPCSGSSMCPPFPHLKPTTSGRATESTKSISSKSGHGFASGNATH